MLNDEGHAAAPHSPSTGVDLLTGDGIAAALDGADMVVNLTNSATFDEASAASSRPIWTTSSPPRRPRGSGTR